MSTLRTSAFEIDLPDASVDLVFCIRLLHHVAESAHRVQILREFHRVSRVGAIFSLWVDGNYQAWRRRRLDRRRERRAEARGGNRFIVRRDQIEAECVAANFRIVSHYDFIPRYAMWRTYVVEKREYLV